MMKVLRKNMFVLPMLVLAVAFAAGCVAVSPATAEGVDSAVMAQPELEVASPAIGDTAAIEDAESEALPYMREEEKLARDVYVTMYDRWGLRVFDNISRAESQHMSAVLTELEARGIADPAEGNALGVFTNTELQALYDKLVAQGDESVVAALTVGATIEDVDIADLQDALNTATDANVQRLFGNLLRGSENHMRAFVHNLARYGAEYSPQYIDADYYESIIAETSGVGGNGWKAGQGGRGQAGRGSGR